MLSDDLRGMWCIMLKDLRAYYLKPPNISWGILGGFDRRAGDLWCERSQLAPADPGPDPLCGSVLGVGGAGLRIGQGGVRGADAGQCLSFSDDVPGRGVRAGDVAASRFADRGSCPAVDLCRRGAACSDGGRLVGLDIPVLDHSGGFHCCALWPGCEGAGPAGGVGLDRVATQPSISQLGEDLLDMEAAMERHEGPIHAFIRRQGGGAIPFEEARGHSETGRKAHRTDALCHSNLRRTGGGA
jgi:hypothetical protein